LLHQLRPWWQSTGARRQAGHERNYTGEVSDSPDSAQGAPAHLVITRDHPQDVQDRPVYLWIDGEKLERPLKYGKTIERDLAPGSHTIKAHNTLFGDTVAFDAAPGETVRYRCENGLSPGGMVMVLMMGVAYLKVKLKRL
jgi:hypothetical protein